MLATLEAEKTRHTKRNIPQKSKGTLIGTVCTPAGARNRQKTTSQHPSSPCYGMACFLSHLGIYKPKSKVRTQIYSGLALASPCYFLRHFFSISQRSVKPVLFLNIETGTSANEFYSYIASPSKPRGSRAIQLFFLSAHQPVNQAHVKSHLLHIYHKKKKKRL